MNDKNYENDERAEAAGQESQEPATPEEALAAVTAERDDLLNRLQRVSADYLNYQKRVVRERNESRDFIVADVIAPILDVIDDLELALNHARQNHPADDPLLVGTEMVHKKALTAFKQLGVEPIETADQPFDPSLHEAIQMAPSADVEPMTILAEVRRGYRQKDRTLRPARVVVAAALESEDTVSPDAAEADGGDDNADV